MPNYVVDIGKQGISPVRQEVNIMILAHVGAAFRQWQHYHENLRELRRLRDNELAVLGLTRAEVSREAMARSLR